jgi:Ca2+-binding EF-hand superfamily protein
LISKEELIGFFKAFIELDEVDNVEDYAKNYFDILDVDTDGVVTAEEFKVLLQSSEEAEVTETQETEETHEAEEDL